MSVSHSEIGKLVGAACIPCSATIAAALHKEVGMQGVVIIVSIGFLLGGIVFAYALKADEWARKRDLRNLEKNGQKYAKKMVEALRNPAAHEMHLRENILDPLGRPDPLVIRALSQLAKDKLKKT